MTRSRRYVKICMTCAIVQTESSPSCSRQVYQINADPHTVMPRLAARFSQQLSHSEHAAISVVILVGYHATMLFQSELCETSLSLALLFLKAESSLDLLGFHSNCHSEHVAIAVVIWADTKPQYSSSPNSVISLLFLKAGKQNFFLFLF